MSVLRDVRRAYGRNRELALRNSDRKDASVYEKKQTLESCDGILTME